MLSELDCKVKMRSSPVSLKQPTYSSEGTGGSGLPVGAGVHKSPHGR